MRRVVCGVWPLIALLGSTPRISGQVIEISAAVALPAVEPAVAISGTSPLTITVSAYVTYPDSQPVLPASVNLLETNAQGSAATILATLHDDGIDGDAIAGDSIFSGRIGVNVQSPGLIHLQVSAGFKGMLLRVKSPLATVEVFPPGVPIQHMPPSSGSSNCTDSNGNAEVCNEVLMFFKPGANYADEVVPGATGVGGTVVGLVSFPTVNIWEVSVPCNSDLCIQKAVLGLQPHASLPDLLGAEADLLAFPLQAAPPPPAPVIPNDPEFPLQWGLAKVQAPLAWSFTTGGILPAGTSVPYVAIVDSGIDVTHPDLAGKVTVGTNWINSRGTATNDELGHGTEVAGIAAATGNNGTAIAGASWRAELIAIKIFAKGIFFGMADTDTATIARGFREAVDLGATVVNFSAGLSAPTGTLAAAVDYINSANRVLVAAAGNDGNNVRTYPAGFELSYQTLFATYNTRKISVGATDMMDARAVFTPPPPGAASNFGTWVQTYAPGVCILTTVRAADPTVANGDPCLLGAAAPPAAARLDFDEGTSFATPLVSGIASLMIAAKPSAGGSFPLLRIPQLSDRLANVNPDGSLLNRVNAFRAVRCAATNVCQ